MYKIVIPDLQHKVADYLTEGGFKKKVGQKMADLINASSWDYYYRSTKKVKLKVSHDSVTYRFLTKYSQGAFLDKLLSGGLNEQLEIIKDVYEGIPDNNHQPTPDDSRFQSISERIRTLRAADPTYDNNSHDDFNSIMRSLFEEKIYNDSNYDPHVDKNQHVKRLGLRVCPYCGRSYIYGLSSVNKNKTIIVKPQIDHFFPKSKYPFLAANFFNLIPCCHSCNMIPAKGDKDTLTNHQSGSLRINHPYSFNDESLIFKFTKIDEETLNPESFQINIDYRGDVNLQNGYHEILFLDDLYSYHNYEACEIYNKFEAWLSLGAKQSYKAIGISNDFFENLPWLIFGYHFDEQEPSKRILYKFNKDILYQMIRDYQRGAQP